MEIRSPLTWDREVLPIYVGDDLLGEDAFKALQKIGITIKVGENEPSFADYFLKNQTDVIRPLKGFLV